MSSAPAPSRRHAAVPLWRDIRAIRIATQVAVVGIVALIVLILGATLVRNMGESRLIFGFGFLGQTAGFEIAQTPIPYGSTDTFARAFTVGLLNTLLVSISGIILATILGVLVGVARLSRNWLVNRLSAGYVEIMRNTPLLVQLFLIYAVLLQLPSVADSVRLPGSIFLNQRGLFMPRPLMEPSFVIWLGVLGLAVALVVGAQMLGRRSELVGAASDAGRRLLRTALVARVAALGLVVAGWLLLSPVSLDFPAEQRFNIVGGVVLSPEFTALLVGLVVYTAAFIGEVVRGGIQAVRRGQIEAAEAIGLTPGQTLRMVVFPQALRIIVPPLTSQYLNLAKNSSLAVAVGFADLFSVGRTMANQTGQPLSVIALVMVTYLALSLITSLFMNIYNRRVQVLER